jgi:hypothetical protein
MDLHKFNDWKNSPSINCEYNLYRKKENINGNSSANFLYQTCKDNLGVMSSISNVIKNFHGFDSINKTIWGYKKIKNYYKWELYNYEEKNCNIKSYEIYPVKNTNSVYISNFYDEYYLDIQQNEFHLGSIYRIKNKEKTKLGIFLLDETCNFKNNFKDYVSMLSYDNSFLTKNILEKYRCKHLCIHQKNNNEFYIQYIGISKKDFLNFLVENEYEDELINHYEKNDYQISNEITLVYDYDFKIKRSSFYGIV